MSLANALCASSCESYDGQDLRVLRHIAVTLVCSNGIHSNEEIARFYGEVAFTLPRSGNGAIRRRDLTNFAPPPGRNVRWGFSPAPLSGFSCGFRESSGCGRVRAFRKMQVASEINKRTAMAQLWIRDGRRSDAAYWASMTEWPRRDQIELIPTAICGCDRSGSLVVYNSAAMALWDAGNPPLRSGFFCGFSRLLQADGVDLKETLSPVSIALALGEPQRDIELIAERMDGKRLAILLDVAPLHDCDGSTIGAVMSFHDISDTRRRLEARYQAMLLGALQRFAGEVAHDFCNAVSPALHYFEVLEKRRGGSPMAQFLTGVPESIRSGQVLADRLFEFFQTSRLSRETIDVNRVVSGTAEAFREVCGEGRLCGVDLDERVLSADVDGSQLERAIRHLLANANEAIGDGGAITVRTGHATVESQQAYLARGDYVVISIIDTGPGMAEDVRTQAFEPLFTTKAGGAHFGLGLSIALGMARQHGGDIQIESSAFGGTTVQIYLPCRDIFAPTVGGAIESLCPENTLRPVPILIVDDDADFRTALIDAFGCLGMTVMEAGTGLSALEILRSDRRVEVLVVDYCLGGMDGTEVLRQAQIIRPGLKALMMTGRLNVPDSRNCFSADVHVLAKPFGVAEFMDRLRHLAPDAWRGDA